MIDKHSREAIAFPDLTDAELSVMKVLWEGESLSAREVHQRLAGQRDWAYSTTRTTLDRMARKGLVARASFHGLYLYSPQVSRPRGLAGIVRRFAESVLEVSPSRVVSLFSESSSLPPEEIEELRRLIDEASE